MGNGNAEVLRELQDLDQQIMQIYDLAGLRPIFYRLDELDKQHAGNLEIQLAVGETKQKLIRRGEQLKESEEADTAIPGANAELPTMVLAVPPPPARRGPNSGIIVPSAPAASAVTLTPSSGTATHPLKSKGPLWAGISVAAMVALAAAAYAWFQMGWKPFGPAVSPVVIATSPPGASISISGEKKCTGECRVSLAEGDYQVQAELPGYEPAAGKLHVSRDQPAALTLTLTPQPQTVRILSDMARGTIVIDGQAPAELKDGQIVLDNVSAGVHNVLVKSPGSEASFSFELSPAKRPVVTGTVYARNLFAVLVTSFGREARLTTNAGPWKLSLNGHAESDAGPSGVQLKGFQSGVDEFVLTQGSDIHSVKESFSPAPTLTAFLKADRNAGTVVVFTGEDDVRVFVNNKEHPHRTHDGELRIRALGPVTIRVAKTGFAPLPVQSADVKRGIEVRLEFALKPVK